MYHRLVDAIRREMAARDLSTSAMARELGLHQQTLDRILKSERGMGIRSLSAILQQRPGWRQLIDPAPIPPQAPEDPEDPEG